MITSSAQFGDDVRQALLSGTQMPESTYDGVQGITQRDDLAGLNLTTVPKVLIECGNMRNATDASLLVTAAFQRSAAAAMAQAIPIPARGRSRLQISAAASTVTAMMSTTSADTSHPAEAA